jgi:hypothetical protein
MPRPHPVLDLFEQVNRDTPLAPLALVDRAPGQRHAGRRWRA